MCTIPQGISLEISYGYFVIFIIFFIDCLDNFIGDFILIAWGNSLSISYLFPGGFNGFFILVLWVFHCQCHIYSLVVSMDFSFLYLQYFIVNFIYIPCYIQWIFILVPWGFHFQFHIYSPALSLDFPLDFSYGWLALSMNISFHYSYLNNCRPCRNFTLCTFICTNIPY